MANLRKLEKTKALFIKALKEKRIKTSSKFGSIIYEPLNKTTRFDTLGVAREEADAGKHDIIVLKNDKIETQEAPIVYKDIRCLQMPDDYILSDEGDLFSVDLDTEKVLWIKLNPSEAGRGNYTLYKTIRGKRCNASVQYYVLTAIVFNARAQVKAKELIEKHKYFTTTAKKESQRKKESELGFNCHHEKKLIKANIGDVREKKQRQIRFQNCKVSNLMFITKKNNIGLDKRNSNINDFEINEDITYILQKTDNKNVKEAKFKENQEAIKGVKELTKRIYSNKINLNQMNVTNPSGSKTEYFFNALNEVKRKYTSEQLENPENYFHRPKRQGKELELCFKDNDSGKIYVLCKYTLPE